MPDEQECEYEKEYGFCVWSSRVASLIEKDSGSYFVGPEDGIAAVVAGTPLFADVPKEVGANVKSQSYFLDGSPIDLPAKFEDLSIGSHILTGTVVGNSGSKIQIAFPFLVKPALEVELLAGASGLAANCGYTQTLVIRNNAPHEAAFDIRVSTAKGVRARAVPHRITVPRESEGAIAVGYELTDGEYEIVDGFPRDAEITVSVSGASDRASATIPVSRERLLAGELQRAIMACRETSLAESTEAAELETLMTVSSPLGAGNANT